MRQRIKPPLCHFCRKPLRRYRWRKEAYLAMAVRYERKAAEIGTQSYYQREAEDSRKRAAEVNPDEQWGSRGDNHFCGIDCGYRWAINQLAAKRFKVPFSYGVINQT